MGGQKGNRGIQMGGRPVSIASVVAVIDVMQWLWPLAKGIGFILVLGYQCWCLPDFYLSSINIKFGMGGRSWIYPTDMHTDMRMIYV
jgi:hypothetical protein